LWVSAWHNGASKALTVVEAAQAAVPANPSVPMRTNTLITKSNRGGSQNPRLLIALTFIILLTACQKNQEQSAELFVFGTIVEIKLWGATPDEASQAFTELQKMFQGMHRDWHAWEPGRLTVLN